ncbi:MAG: hypothetical protein AABW72_03645 [archaeon]
MARRPLSFGRRRVVKSLKSPTIPQLKLPKTLFGKVFPRPLELPFARKGEPNEGTLQHLAQCKAEFERARDKNDFREMHFWKGRFDISIKRFLGNVPEGFGTEAFESYCRTQVRSASIQSDVAESREWEDLRNLSEEYRKQFLLKKKN